jgi:glycosyltransferase involved in cell wall biosynthesis
MYNRKKIVVVMPAYNAAQTLTQTVDEVLQQNIVDEIILVDDRSRDETVQVASSLLGVRVHVHEKNTGYGGNQKTCYRLALEAGADIVIMVHPDYQYAPKLIPALASMIANDLPPCVLASRILGGYSLQGGMPTWKYVVNRFLTAAEIFCSAPNFPNITPAIAASRRSCCRSWICPRTPMISYSTTRCSRKPSGTVSPSAK